MSNIKQLAFIDAMIVALQAQRAILEGKSVALQQADKISTRITEIQEIKFTGWIDVKFKTWRIDARLRPGEDSYEFVIEERKQ